LGVAVIVGVSVTVGVAEDVIVGELVDVEVKGGVAVDVGVKLLKVEVGVQARVASVGETFNFRLHPVATINKVAGMQTANRAHKRKDFMLPPEKRYLGI
jgi:SHS2 domain-containing protein